MSSDNRPHTAGKLRIHEGKLKPFPHEELGKEVRNGQKTQSKTIKLLRKSQNNSLEALQSR